MNRWEYLEGADSKEKRQTRHGTNAHDDKKEFVQSDAEDPDIWIFEKTKDYNIVAAQYTHADLETLIYNG